MSFMTGCSAAEQTKTETEKFVLTMQTGSPVMMVNGENKNIDENGNAMNAAWGGIVGMDKIIRICTS